MILFRFILSLFIIIFIVACSETSETQKKSQEKTKVKNDNKETQVVNSNLSHKSENITSKENHNCLEGLPTYDKDLIGRGNLQIVKENNIQVFQCVHSVNNQSFKIDIYKKQPIGNFRYLALHDSEDAAFDGGIDAIKNGGLMVVLENNEQRYFYDQNQRVVTKYDPNRIFKPSDPYFSLGEAILSYLEIKPNSHIISLHNNNPNGGFGMKNIKNYGATDIVCHKNSDDKNLFWVSYSGTASNAHKVAKQLCLKNNYNVVMEQVPETIKGDGSLSIYAVNKGYSYVNIEIRAAKRNDNKSEQIAKSQQIAHVSELKQVLNSL